MVGYTVNTGSSEEFADGWDRVFGSKGSGPKKSKKAVVKKTVKASAKTRKKSAAKKKSAGKKKSKS